MQFVDGPLWRSQRTPIANKTRAAPIRVYQTEFLVVLPTPDKCGIGGDSAVVVATLINRKYLNTVSDAIIKQKISSYATKYEADNDIQGVRYFQHTKNHSLGNPERHSLLFRINFLYFYIIFEHPV